ncbi:BnaC03g75720D [Brassica napus]|uniref:BnaC03g75720D protein n=1 Tax=Brassica napus TaxID=3708 RepID=A0A078IPY8_BRANA|nr:BnaC03g75720D [Brassica napus]
MIFFVFVILRIVNVFAFDLKVSLLCLGCEKENFNGNIMRVTYDAYYKRAQQLHVNVILVGLPAIEKFLKVGHIFEQTLRGSGFLLPTLPNVA